MQTLSASKTIDGRGRWKRTPESLVNLKVALNHSEVKERQRRAKLGKIVSSETREKMRQAKLGRPGPWTGKKRGPLTVEWRKKIGDGNRGKMTPEWHAKIAAANTGKKRTPEQVARMRVVMARPDIKERLRQANVGKPATHAKGKQFWYGDIRMRSSYELRTAAAFDAIGIQWVYEPKRFWFVKSTYTPDFYLPDEDIYVEVKGWYGPDSATKCRLFLEHYPNETLAIIMKPQMLELERIAASK